MPNRILRDWTDSEVINSLSADAERFFTRLLMKADDYGRYTANPKLIKASLFPLLIDSIREADISRWTAEAAKAGLIALYEVDSKPYLVIPKFGQRMRNSRPKYPIPPDQLSAANSPQLAATCGESPPEAHSETETEAQPEAEAKSRAGARGESPPGTADPWREIDADEALDSTCRQWIGRQSAVMYSHKSLGILREMVKAHGWDQATKAVLEAAAKGRTEPFSYARQVLNSQAAQREIEGTESPEAIQAKARELYLNSDKTGT